jgi:hypothetical protein
LNKDPIRALTARRDDAQSPNVVSAETPVIHDLQIMVIHGFRAQKNMQL